MQDLDRNSNPCHETDPGGDHAIRQVHHQKPGTHRKCPVDWPSKQHNPQIDPEHLLAAMLAEKGRGGPVDAAQSWGCHPEAVAQDIAAAHRQASQGHRRRPTSTFLHEAGPNCSGYGPLAEAAKMKDEYVSIEHIPAGRFRRKNRRRAVKSSDGYGVNRETILRVLMEIRGNQRITDPQPRGKIPGPGQIQPGSHRPGAEPASSTRSSAGTKRFAASFRSCPGGPKNNPVLIGEPGVGKTAIVEGLAQRIVARRRAGDR